MAERRTPEQAAVARPVLGILRSARGIAVIGASNNRNRPGGRLVAALLRHGFRGAIVPVNPNQHEVQGLRCFPSLDEVTAPVDVGVILVPAEQVADAVDACGAAGVRLAIVGSAGFAEAGGSGADLQADLLARARRHGMRLLGPNTNGAVVVPTGLAANFSPALHQPGLALRDGPVAIVAQSGALGAALFGLAQAQGLPVGTLVNTGNEADTRFEEVLAELCSVESPASVVLGYLEGLSDAATLIRAARSALAGDRVIATLKVGTTEHGAQAAAAHTAKLAGADRTVDGVFRQLGIVRAGTLTELLGIGRLAATYGPRIGTRLSIASMSGGAGIILADAAIRAGLALAAWTDHDQAALDGWLPAYLGRANPIDLGGGPFRDLSHLQEILLVLDAHPGSDVTVLGIVNFEEQQEPIATAIRDVATRMTTPLVVVWFGAATRARDELNRAGVPAFAEPEDAIRAVAALAHRRPGGHGTVPATPSTRRDRALDLLAAHRDPVLPATVARGLLTLYGVPVAEQVAVPVSESPPATLPLPSVLKLSSRLLPHKSDVGAVITARTRDDVSRAVARLRVLAERYRLDDAELIAQERVPRGVELLLGMSRDPLFGPVVTLGIGGVLAEAFDDVAVRLPPLDRADVAHMLDELRHQSLLRGFRGLPSIDAERIGPVVTAFADLAVDIGDRFTAVDLNPVIVTDAGATAVDALFVRATAG